MWCGSCALYTLPLLWLLLCKQAAQAGEDVCTFRPVHLGDTHLFSDRSTLVTRTFWPVHPGDKHLLTGPPWWHASFDRSTLVTRTFRPVHSGDTHLLTGPPWWHAPFDRSTLVTRIFWPVHPGDTHLSTGPPWWHAPFDRSTLVTRTFWPVHPGDTHLLTGPPWWHAPFDWSTLVTRTFYLVHPGDTHTQQLCESHMPVYGTQSAVGQLAVGQHGLLVPVLVQRDVTSAGPHAAHARHHHLALLRPLGPVKPAPILALHRRSGHDCLSGSCLCRSFELWNWSATVGVIGVRNGRYTDEGVSR